MQKGPLQVVRSSVIFHLLLYLHKWWNVIFFAAELLLYVFKGENFPFPTGVLAAEVCVVLVWIAVECGRLYFGNRVCIFHLLVLFVQ